MGFAALKVASGRSVHGKIYRVLGVLFATLLVTTAIHTTYSQRSLVEELVESQTTDLAQSYFDNINTLMLTGGMANRDIPRKKVLSRPEVLDARIVRGESVIKLYGAGSDYAKPFDEFDQRGLAGETLRLIRDTEQGAWFRGCRHRGSEPGQPSCNLGQGNQGTDPDLGFPGAGRYPVGG